VQKRLVYIDGIRGLLALWVALLHTLEIYGAGLRFLGVASHDMLTDDLFGRFVRFIQLNLLRIPLPVEAFIVISGYSLMLVVARRPDGRPNGGLKGYFLRRVRRIWPPYYGAVAVSLLLTALVPAMSVKSGVYWDLALPSFNLPVIASHLLFIHNWYPELFFKLNPPMWTIAVEEQIYILFPFLLLPVWRRFGTLPMWATAGLVGVGLMAMNRQVFGTAHSWFLMLFGFGALAACVNFSEGAWELWLRKKVPWPLVGTAAAVVAIYLWRNDFLPVPIRDGATATAVISLLITLTERWKTNATQSGLVAWLSSYPIALLGSFSYSLYLMHSPILTALSKAVLALGLRGNAAYLAMFLVGLPLTVLCCYGFHRIFERPFLAHGAYPIRSNQMRSSCWRKPASRRCPLVPGNLLR
jgi:peptidoglycan/LPS O-acetylase OafA/YrhL